jgi:AT-binding transcription factor 1
MASLSMLSSLYSQGFVAPLPGFEGKAEDALKRYATDYLANAGNNNATPTPAAATNEQRPSTGNPTGELPLDLSRPLPLQQGLGQVRPESAMQSDVGTDDNRSEHYMDYFDESNPSSPLPYSKMGGGGNQSNSGNASMTGSASGGQNKRFRTQMSAVQVRVMKSLFSDYKTPTMAECEALGREIGLPKRVVQVWFQNARAKEKKNKLNAQKAAGDLSGIESNLGTKQPEGCDLCDFKYSHKYAVQDHIFTHQHIERVKIHVAEQSGKHSDDMPTTVARPSKGGHQQESQEPSTPTPVGGSSAEMTTSPPNSNATESAQLEALLLHQLYGMGYGAAGVPAAALAAAAAAAAASSSYNNSQQQSSTNVMAGGES